MQVDRAVLVGRDPEIRLFQAAAQRAGGGARSTIVVEGDAGIGKTALIESFAVQLIDDGWVRLVIQCGELDTERPFVPLVEGMRVLLDNLQAKGIPAPAELPDALEQFRMSFRTDRDDDRQSGERILSLVEDGLSELAEVAPVLVVFDDIHWIDEGSAKLLWSTARSRSSSRVLVVACTRPTQRETTTALRRALDDIGVVTTTLRPLSAQESELLALQSVEKVDARVRAVLRNADGNPLFITELLRSTDDPSSHEELSSTSIPESLRRIVMGRLLRLPELTMSLLVDAALLGESFDVVDLCLLHSVEPSEMVLGLEPALLERIVVGNGRRFRFQHGLVQTVVAESRADPIRRVRHREIGESLERAGRPATQVAEHYWMSVPYQNDRTRTLLRKASAEVRTLSLESALVWAERARRCASGREESFVDQLDIAELLLLRGNLTEAEAICRRAEVVPETVEEELRLRSVLLAVTTMAGRTRHSEALEHVDWILARHHEGEPMWVELMSGKAALLLLAGELESSIEIAHETLEKNLPSNPPFVVSRTYECLGLNAMLLGHVTESLALTQRAMDTFDFQRNLLSEVMTPHFGRSLTMLSSRPIGEIEATLQAGIRECDRTGHALARLHLEPFLAITHFVRGDLASTSGCVDAILDRNSDWRSVEWETGSDQDRQRGRRETDRFLMTPTGRRKSGIGTAGGVSLPTVTGLAAYLALLNDQIDDAVALADRTILELLEGGAQAATADFAIWCAAGVYEANGDPGKARDLLLTIWELMAKTASLYTIAPDLVRLTVESHPDVAREVVSLADARFDRSGAPLDHAHALACRGFLEHDPKRLRLAAQSWESLGWLLTPTRIRQFALELAADSGGRSRIDSNEVKRVRENWGRMEAVRPLRIFGLTHPVAPLSSGARGRKPHERSTVLSQTERMVALLVAEGLTNKEIAERLFISYRTVDTHVSHALAKLGFNSRVQLAGFVMSEL
jgi:DNA-binding CsgD family transcriptional regulator